MATKNPINSITIGDPPDFTTTVTKAIDPVEDTSFVAYGVSTPVDMGGPICGVFTPNSHPKESREALDALVGLVADERMKRKALEVENLRLKKLLVEIYGMVCPGWAGDFGNPEHLKSQISQGLSDIANKK